MPRQPLISVVIPTYNRAVLLERSLASLVDQSIPIDDYEVIVVDDGSTDATLEVCHRFLPQLPLSILRQENSGNAAAKNLGLFASKGWIAFFFDDDDVADRRLLEEHLATHRRYPQETVAVLGHTTWHPELEVTPLMHYITDVRGILFSYGTLEDGQELDFRYFWGGRSSCKRSLLVKHGVFDPLFRWTQDIELGWRLARFGLKVIYNRKARSFMIRPVDYDAFCRRSERKGEAQAMLSRLHPDPVIRRYAEIDGAVEKWERRRATLDEKVHRVRALEMQWAAAAPAERNRILPELEHLYGWTLHTFKLKGIAKVLSAEQGAGRIPEKDLQRFQRKWGKDRARFAPLPRLPKREKVLVVGKTPPLYDKASGEYRFFQIVRLLSKHFDVTFVAGDARGAERYVEALKDLGVTVLANDVDRFPALRGAFPPLELEGVLREKNFKAAFLEFHYVADLYVDLIREHAPETVVITDSVDLHFLRSARQASTLQDGRRLLEADEVKRRELSAYLRSDVTLTVTDVDRSFLLQECPGLDVRVLPNIHDIPAQGPGRARRSGLLFVGGFPHAPNVDAVIHFCQDVLPLLRRRLPEVKVTLVGNAPPPEVLTLRSREVVVTGHVPSTAPYLQSALVSIAPLRYGAGMKGKIGEAMAHGVPVVTTRIGAEGFGAVDGEHLLVADDPEAFAEAVVRLHEDPDLWERLSRNGRRFIEDHCGIRAAEEAILELMHDLPPPRRRVPECFRVRNTEPPPLCERDRVTVIVLASENTEKTRRCVERIRLYTDSLHDLLVVDPSRRRETTEWLERNFVKYVPTEGSREAETRAVGLAASASSEYVAFVRGETVVTPHWDRRLTAHFAQGDRAAAVSARSATEGYETLFQLEEMADRHYEEHRGETRDMEDPATSPCLLFHARTLHRVEGGTLADLVRDSRNRGLRFLLARDTLVYDERTSRPPPAPTLRPAPRRLLSLVVVASSASTDPSRCLESLAALDGIGGDVEVLVVLGRKGRRNGRAAPETSLPVRWIPGCADALARAVRRARGRYLVVLRADTAPAHPEFLEEHLRLHEEDPSREKVLIGDCRGVSQEDRHGFLARFFAMPHRDRKLPLRFDPYQVTNLSGPRDLFLKLGFGGGLVFGWEARRFYHRAELEGKEIGRSEKILTRFVNPPRIEEIRPEEEAGGRQFALLAWKHPGRIWNAQHAKDCYVKDFLWRERLGRRLREAAARLDPLLEGPRRPPGIDFAQFLCASILNYHFAAGIWRALNELEGTDWPEEYLAARYRDRTAAEEAIRAENEMYEKLLEGLLSEMEGDPARAEDLLESARARRPESAHPHYYLADLQLRRERYREAESHLRSCLAKAALSPAYTTEVLPLPDKAALTLYLALALLRQGRSAEAARLLGEAFDDHLLRSGEQERLALRWLALCHEDQGDPEGAIDAYGRILETASHDEEACQGLSLLYWKMGHDRDARVVAEHFLERNMEGVTLLPARDGRLTAKVKKGEKSLLLHSLYRPLEEAERRLPHRPEDLADKIVVQLGVGLGYPLLALWKRLPPGTPVLAVERRTSLFLLALVHNLRSRLLPAGTPFEALVGDRDPAELEGLLRRLRGDDPRRQVVVFEHPPSLTLDPEYYAACLARLGLRGRFTSGRASEEEGERIGA